MSNRKRLSKPRRASLDLAAEYKRLGRKMKECETRMHEIKTQVIASGGRLETRSGLLAIEYAERRAAPSISDLEKSGHYDFMAREGLIRRVQVQILRVIGKTAKGRVAA